MRILFDAIAVRLSTIHSAARLSAIRPDNWTDTTADGLHDAIPTRSAGRVVALSQFRRRGTKLPVSEGA